MLNININYPYPVIREYTDDYQSTEFIGELKVLLEPDGYAVHTNFEINNKIRLIELFAGVGSQAMALKRLAADFEHYKVVEFDKYAIKSYNAIHGTDFMKIPDGIENELSFN